MQKSDRTGRAIAGCVVLMAVGAMSGCSGDLPSGPKLDTNPANVFHHVRINHSAVTLTGAPYDTITLSATAYSALGTAFPREVTPVKFSSSDTTSILVSDVGHVTVRKVGGAAWIRASVTRGGVTLTDSAFVARPTNDPVVTGVSAMPVAPDTSKVAATLTKSIVTFLTGTSLANVAVAYELGDTTVAKFGSTAFPEVRTVSRAASTGRVTASLRTKIPGKVWIHLSAHIRGTTWRDSVLFTVGVRSTAGFFIESHLLTDGSIGFAPNISEVRLMVGGTASWSGSAVYPYSVVFEDSSKARPGGASGPSAMSGNIPLWVPESPLNTGISRKFIRPDTIRWSSPERDVHGTIIVVDERPCQPNCPPFP